jgi:hypothetical protein
MFLVKDQIQTEPIWTAFIASAAELALRKSVPPTRPQPPDLFPRIPPIKDEMKTTCWRHGGVAVPLVVPPRERFDGARSGLSPVCRFVAVPTVVASTAVNSGDMRSNAVLDDTLA